MAQANANAIAEPTLGYIAPEVTSLERTESIGLANRKSTKGKWQRFVSWIWDPDYYEKSDAERALVNKMDLGILIPIVFGYIMKSIDQNNLSNAYVSGMREDLAMTRNEYTYCLVIYSAVYCVLQVPGNLLVLKFRPSIVLAICECSWGAFTFAQAGAQNVQQIYVFRFFVAFFEAPFQPAVILLLGSWYTPRELAKRVSIWFIAARTGAAFSGFMQAAIYRTMDGLAGLPGWRWLYIICGIMTMPCGVALYFFLPDFPDTTRVWYLTPEDRAMAKERCALQGTKPHTGVVDRQTFKRIIKRWHFWAFLPTYFFYAWSVQSYTVFGPYLLQLDYPISMRNIYPALSELIGLPCVLTWGYLSDRFQSRFAFTFGPLATLGLFGTGVLCFYSSSKPLRLTSFMISHTYFVTNIFYTWVNECCKDDAAERAFVIAASNSFFYAFNAWLPTILFLQTDGPRWRKGFPSLFGSVFGACLMFTVVWFLHKRQLREEAAARENNRGGVEAIVLPDGDTKEEIK